jgi:hypothetical protein
MSDGSGKLTYAAKNLRRKWDEAAEQWRDRVKDDFEARHIHPLITQTTATGRGMHTLDEIIQKMRRDCS